MLNGDYLLMSVKEVQGKNGKYNIIRIGDSANCSSCDVYGGPDLAIPAGIRAGEIVNVDIELVGSKNLFARCKAIKAVG